jgi:hypothetical protein
LEPALASDLTAQLASRPVTTARSRAVAPDGRVTVEGAEIGTGSARVAIAAGYSPAVGDTVLLASDAGGARYVIGVLAALRPVPSVEASDGTRAAVERSPAGEVLRVTDARGRLLFEHHPALGRSVVHAPEGDLDFEAAGRLRLRGASVAIEAADALAFTARHATQAFATLETSVGRLIERAAEAYRACEGLAETRAGRLRLVAEKTLHALAERALVKGREEVKLKAEKIYLG